MRIMVAVFVTVASIVVIGLPPSSLSLVRSRRSSSSGGPDHSLACEMLIAVDEPLYAHLGRRMEHVTQLITYMMGQLNHIYHRTFLRLYEAEWQTTRLLGEMKPK